MGQTDDPWPPGRWRWPPADHHMPGMWADVLGIARHHAAWRRLSPDDAEDVAQEVIVELLSPGPAGDHPESYDGFRRRCGRVASNVARRLARRQGRQLPLSFEPPATPTTPSDVTFESLLNELNDEQMRAVVRAKFVDGMSYARIAERFGLTVDRVANLVRRARIRLQRRGYGRGPAEEAS